ncbi:MAG: hypothetical protein LIP18_04540 [Planctomycetes bacterium]|nr:hypothetical protein [Planctomycetota bacterium]
MPVEREKTLIFGRYSREECGLPPIGADVWHERFGVWKIVGLAAVVAILGWFAGGVSARYREARLRVLPAEIFRADADRVPALLAEGKMLAAALPHNRRMRRDLAYGLAVAGARARARLGDYGSAASVLDHVDSDSFAPGVERFAGLVTTAGFYEETGDFEAAFARLEAAEQALRDIPDDAMRNSYRLLLANARAYRLAIAPRNRGGDPDQALKLAQLMITSRDRLPGGGYASDSAAFLDTLAAARHATGDHAGAVQAQRMALGLAEQSNLAVYLNHYDEFTSAVE